MSSKWKLERRNKLLKKTKEEAWLPYIHKLNLSPKIAILSRLIQYYVVELLCCGRKRGIFTIHKSQWISWMAFKISDFVFYSRKDTSVTHFQLPQKRILTVAAYKNNLNWMFRNYYYYLFIFSASSEKATYQQLFGLSCFQLFKFERKLKP